MIAKRLLDVAISVCALTLLLPLMLFVTIGIKLDSPGPALYRQQRVGLGGHLFSIVKFRTMLWQPGHEGSQISAARDARVTRVGAFLREYKLDELPQLWNVLVGDMSLVGPRPEVPRYVHCYSETQRATILSVRPGVTDLASLEFIDESRLLGDAGTVEQVYIDHILPRKLELYEKYVRERSFPLDVQIMCRTVWRLVCKIFRR